MLSLLRRTFLFTLKKAFIKTHAPTHRVICACMHACMHVHMHDSYPIFKKYVEKLVGKATTVNFGIGGSMTQHLIWRIEKGFIKHCNPDKVK